MIARRGVTLLETLVALVILSIVAVSFLELFGTSARTAASAETWATAIALAERGIEDFKLGREHSDPVGPRLTSAGYARTVDVRPWRGDVDVVTVTVSLPGGGEYRLERLVGTR